MSDSPSKDHGSRPSGSRLPAWLRAIDVGLGKVEQALLCVLLLALVTIAAGQAVATQFGVSWDWSDELIRYSVFFIAMTGAALSAQTEQLIAMDFVTRILRPRARARLKIALRVFTIAICVLFVIGGLGARGLTTAETNHYFISSSAGLLALPIGGALIAIHVLFHLVIDLSYLAGGQLPPEDDKTPIH